MSVPSCSIVIACKNPGPRLEAALESVWQQREAACEVIVIDGASSDGTREWLEANRRRLATLVVERDRGVYDAMNKGIAAATGDWVLFLGADDRLAADNVLSASAHRLAETKAAVVVGEVLYDDGRIYRLSARPNPWARNFVHHQGAFYRRSLFSKVGVFDPTLRIMGDYDFNLRLWKTEARFEAFSVRVAVCSSRGLSDSGAWQVYAEELAVRHRHFAAWHCWFWDAGSAVRFARKQFVRRVLTRG